MKSRALYASIFNCRGDTQTTSAFDGSLMYTSMNHKRQKGSREVNFVDARCCYERCVLLMGSGVIDGRDLGDDGRSGWNCF
jgi:hypothetical protein